MVLNTLLSGILGKAMSDSDKGLKPVASGRVINQGLAVSSLNLESGRYAPAAVSQFDISGMDAVNTENEDIRIVLDTKTGLYRFKNNTARDWLKGSSGTLVSQPAENEKVLKALRYQGFDTVDVSGGQ